jgi:hypothetical protein
VLTRSFAVVAVALGSFFSLGNAQAQEPFDGNGFHALNRGNPWPSSPIRIVYEGEWTLEAHLAKPHDRITRGTRLTLLDGAGEGTRLDWATWDPRKPDAVETETTWIDGERVVHRESEKSPLELASGLVADLLRARVEAVAPWRALFARGSRAGTVDGFAWVCNADGARPARRLSYQPSTSHMSSCALTSSHPRLGDASDEVRWLEWCERRGVQLAGAVHIEAPGGSSGSGSPETFELHLVSVEPAGDFGDALDLPDDISPQAAAPDPRTAAIDVSDLTPGVVSFASKQFDARTITVEFEDHLIAIGAPLSSALSERMLAAIAKRFPSKPVRYVAFGHHHPHYTGGLRAFLAAGATVVATPGNSRYVAEIAALPFTIEPDAWAKRESREPKVESFTDRREFADASQQLSMIDIGSRSNHTDEYCVFYLPRSRTLIEDDIGWFAATDGKLNFGARSRGLRDAIVERGLDVATIVQGWPVANPRPSITFAELDQGVNATAAPRSK